MGWQPHVVHRRTPAGRVFSGQVMTRVPRNRSHTLAQRPPRIPMANQANPRNIHIALTGINNPETPSMPLAIRGSAR